MPTPKTELMNRLRAERRAQGLVKVEIWTQPENKEKVKQFADKLTSKSLKSGII